MPPRARYWTLMCTNISLIFLEIWKIGEVISFIEILWRTIQNFTWEKPEQNTNISHWKQVSHQFYRFFASKVSHPNENGLIVAKIVFVVLSSFFLFFLPSVCLTIDARVCCVAMMPRIANTSDKQLKSSSSRSRRKPGEREWERTREGVREH